ncbi:MAG: TspO/MBR family protein [Clostridia bacterium]
MKKFSSLLISILIPLSIGLFSSFLTKNSILIYSHLNLPNFAPNSSIFPIVWTILYILMGISSYIMYKNGHSLNLYKKNLVLNFLWPIIFFNFDLYIVAFAWLIILLVVVIAMAKDFFAKEKLAGILQIPYILWIIFAGILNLSIIFLNGSLK